MVIKEKAQMIRSVNRTINKAMHYLLRSKEY